MIFLKTEDEIELLRQSNLLVGKTLAEVAKLIKPGITTRELSKDFLINMEIRFLVLYVLLLMTKSYMVFREILF